VLPTLHLAVEPWPIGPKATKKCIIIDFRVPLRDLERARVPAPTWRAISGRFTGMAQYARQVRIFRRFARRSANHATNAEPNDLPTMPLMQTPAGGYLQHNNVSPMSRRQIAFEQPFEQQGTWLFGQVTEQTMTATKGHHKRVLLAKGQKVVNNNTMVKLHIDHFTNLCTRAEDADRLEREGIAKIYPILKADNADQQRVIDAADPVAAIGVNVLASLQKEHEVHSQLDVEKKKLENVKTNLENQLLQQLVEDGQRRSMVGIKRLKEPPTAATSSNFARMPKLPSVPD
jgi:hypothetical protein